VLLDAQNVQEAVVARPPPRLVVSAGRVIFRSPRESTPDFLR
jgi:hypothetical protein